MLYHRAGLPIQPGNEGKDCPLRAKTFKFEGGEERGYCQDCFYLKCCVSFFNPILCRVCRDFECPRAGKRPYEPR